MNKTLGISAIFLLVSSATFDVAAMMDWQPKSYSGGAEVCHEGHHFKAKWWAGANDVPDVNGPTSPIQAGWGSEPWLPIQGSKICQLAMNTPPVAIAGEDMTIRMPEHYVTLDASQSYDKDQDKLTYLWVQISGPSAEISTPDSLLSNVVFPDVQEPTRAVFQLTVSDGEYTSKDDISVDILPSESHELIPRTFMLDQPGKGRLLQNEQLRGYEPTPLQSTGFWVEEGETLTVSVTGLAHATLPKLFISLPDDRTHKFKHAEQHSLTQGLNHIPVTKSGILYLYYDSDPVDNAVQIDLASGGTPFPRFKLDSNSSEDWSKMLEQYSDIPYIELVGRNIIITTKKYPALNYIQPNGPEELILGWDNVIDLAQEQYAITSDDRNSPHRKILHKFHFVDGLSPAGVNNPNKCTGALNAWAWRIMACSEKGLKNFFDMDGTSVGAWGPWHELGHHMQLRAFTWAGLGEVTVNLTSLYINRAFNRAPVLESKGTWDKEIFPYLSNDIKNFSALSVWAKLGMFWQLDLTFGEDFYQKLAVNYRESSINMQALSNSQKIQQFVIETSKTSGFNLTEFFTTWGIEVTSTTEAELHNLGLPVLHIPIWENRDNHIKYKVEEK